MVQKLTESALRKKTRVIVNRLGVDRASAELGVSKDALVRFLAALPVRKGTIAQLTIRIDDAESSPTPARDA